MFFSAFGAALTSALAGNSRARSVGNRLAVRMVPLVTLPSLLYTEKPHLLQWFVYKRLFHLFFFLLDVHFVNNKMSVDWFFRVQEKWKGNERPRSHGESNPHTATKYPDIKSTIFTPQLSYLRVLCSS